MWEAALPGMGIPAGEADRLRNRAAAGAGAACSNAVLLVQTMRSTMRSRAMPREAFTRMQSPGRRVSFR